MCPRYVSRYAKGAVDFDRASVLMNKELLKESEAARDFERDNCPRPDADYGVQWIWDYYCERHYEHYGQAFEPDINPDWI